MGRTLPPQVRVAEIIKILDRRNPPPAEGLPADDRSRLQLCVLLDHHAMSGKVDLMRKAALMLAAAWLSDDEIDELVEERLKLRRRWDTEEDRKELAELFQLSVDERDDLGIRTIRPVDAHGVAFDDDAMEARRRRAKALWQADYRRKKAAEAASENVSATVVTPTLSERALLVYERINASWRSTTTIARAVKRSHRFAGKKHHLDTVRKVVTRAAAELRTAELIQGEMRTGANGQQLLFFRRKD